MHRPTYHGSRFLITLTLILTGAGLAGCGKSSTAPAAGGPRTQVLVLSDAGAEDSLIAVLRAAGLSVVEGEEAFEYDGGDLERFAAVVLPVGLRYGDSLSIQLAQRLQQYVAAGGGLLTTDWMSYYRTTTFANMAPLIVARSVSSYRVDETETYTVLRDHPVVAGLPASFALSARNSFAFTRRDSVLHPGSRTLIQGSLSGAAVVVDSVGMGRVIHWNLAPGYGTPSPWNVAMRVLFVQAVRHVARL